MRGVFLLPRPNPRIHSSTNRLFPHRLQLLAHPAHHDQILAERFRLVHRGVSAAQEIALLLFERILPINRQMLRDAERSGEEAGQVKRRHAEAPLAREERRLLDRAPDLLADGDSILELRVRKDDHELVAAVARDGRVALLNDPFQQETDLAQDLAAGEMSVPVVDGLEAIEVHEDEHGLITARSRVRERLGEPDVEPAVVVETSQIIFLGQLVGAFRVERVLQREGRVAGEDLQQRLVALGEDAAVEPVDQLEHAADGLADVDRNADDRVGFVAELLVEVSVEEVVLFHVRGNVRRAGLVDLPHDAEFRGEALADQIPAGVAERGDEDQLVLATHGYFAEGIVEEDRARFGWDEFVRLLQDLAEYEVEIDVAFE